MGNYSEYDCNYTKYASLKNSVSINFSGVITTFRGSGRHSVYEQKNSSSPNYVQLLRKLESNHTLGEISRF